MSNTVCFIFLQIDAATWGIDWEGPVGTPDPEAAVEVPLAPQNMQQTVEGHLRLHIDPFLTSEEFGVDIYRRALSMAQDSVAAQV